MEVGAYARKIRAGFQIPLRTKRSFVDPQHYLLSDLIV